MTTCANCGWKFKYKGESKQDDLCSDCYEYKINSKRFISNYF